MVGAVKVVAAAVVAPVVALQALRQHHRAILPILRGHRLPHRGVRDLLLQEHRVQAVECRGSRHRTLVHSAIQRRIGCFGLAQAGLQGDCAGDAVILIDQGALVGPGCKVDEKPERRESPCQNGG